MSFGEKGDAWLLLSNDNLRLLKCRRTKNSILNCDCIGWVNYPTSSDSDRRLGTIVFDAEIVVHCWVTCWEENSWIIWIQFGKPKFTFKAFLAVGRGMWRFGRLYDFGLIMPERIKQFKLILTPNRRFNNHSVHSRFLPATATFDCCSTVYDRISRIAFLFAFLLTLALVKVDCFDNKTLRGFRAFRCHFCSQGLTPSSLLSGSWASFRHQAPNRDEFQRPVQRRLNNVKTLKFYFYSQSLTNLFKDKQKFS